MHRTVPHRSVQPVCSPTRSALMTARYPFKLGFGTLTPLPPACESRIPTDKQTTAEAFAAAGYECAAIGKVSPCVFATMEGRCRNRAGSCFDGHFYAAKLTRLTHPTSALPSPRAHSGTWDIASGTSPQPAVDSALT